jgi:hypothetical protein
MPVPCIRLTTNFLLVATFLCPFRVQLQPKQQTTDETARPAQVNFSNLFLGWDELVVNAQAYRTPIQAGKLRRLDRINSQTLLRGPKQPQTLASAIRNPRFLIPPHKKN